MTPTPALNAAVCKVMQRVTHIKETGKNEHHGYKYASDEDRVAWDSPVRVERGRPVVHYRVMVPRG